MIFGGELVIFICLIAKRGVAISGFPGFEDFQDVIG
jgi:hypothetical protein